MLMEVPTGIIADRFGRRTSRIPGRLVAMVGTALMIGSRSFWGFALAFVFVALSFNLESGGATLWCTILSSSPAARTHTRR